jgi:hypothetical protein
MADDLNKMKNWIKKWTKDKVDIGAGEEKPHTTDTAENLRQAADKADIGAGEEKPHTTDTAENLRQAADKADIGAGEEKPHTTDTAENLREAEENLREAEENLRGEAAKIDEDEKLDDSMPPEKILEHEPATVKPYKDNPKIIEKGRVGVNMLARKPIVTTLVVVAIILGGFLLYSQIQLTNQSYKIENFNALWNQSLADLRSGNTSMEEYCINRVHDEELCNRFMSLQYMG